MTSQPYQQPGYPAQQPNYAPQPGYQAQPQQYQQPAPPVQPGPSVPPPSLRDFMNQPAGGGNSLSFMQAGTRYSGTVIRTVTGADVDYAKEMQDNTKIAKFNDGRDKLILKVPVLLDQPSAQYPDGTATWILKSNDRNELMRAMEAAGAQPDPELGFFRPQAGDWFSVTYTHDQPSGRGLNPRKVKVVEYRVGNGVPPQMPQYQQAPPPPPQQYQQAPPPPPQQYQQAPGVQWGNQQQFAQPQYQQAAPGPQVPGNTNWQQPQYQQNQVAAPPPQPPQFDPVQAQQFQQQYQQPSFPQPQVPPTPGAPAAQPGFTPGAQPTGYASPSNGDGPPPDWPADVAWIKGLTPDMARTVQAMHVGQQLPQ